MDFIQSSNKQVDKFGPGKHGFSAGNPTGGILATYFTNVWADGVQQEIINAIEAAGLVPSAAVLNQLMQAIPLLAPGRLGAIRVLTGAGTFTKSAGCKDYEAFVLGAGGGGGTAPATGSNVGMASGGSGGAHCTSYFKNASSASFAYSCGAGGAANTAGGATTFSYPGAVMTAPGGPPGGGGGPGSIPVASPGAPNSAGGATGGNIYNTTTMPGGPGLILTSGAAISGSGGNSPMGTGGSGTSGGGGGLGGQGFGAGGAGGLTGNGSGAQAGGNGTPGVIVVREYF